MYLCIDLGGTKTLIGLLDESGTVKNSVKFPTPEKYEQFLVELRQNIENLIGNNSVVAGCMAIPGTIDRVNGLITHLGNLPWAQNITIKKDVEEFLSFPVTIENDANLAGLSEATLLKDTYKKALYLTISTGIGGVLVVDGIIDKDTMNAEMGHMLFEHEGKLTEWEDMASGKWIVETYGKRASDLEDASAWRTISQNLAVGFMNLINVLSPDVIIMGGGVGTHLEKFKATLEEEIAKINPGFAPIPPIVKAQRPEEAVIYGCYELIKQ
jgi:predicted NBD/HSP70 family sugar kinase